MNKKELRWTVEMAAAEFGINPRTLVGRIKRLGLKPVGNTGGKNKSALFTTKQMAQAVYGDLEMERIRKTKEEADQLELENEESRGNLISAEKIKTDLLQLGVSVRTIVEASHLAQDEKDKICSAMAKAVDAIAA